MVFGSVKGRYAPNSFKKLRKVMKEIWESFEIKRDRVREIERDFVCDLCECLASKCKVCKTH